MKAREGPDHHCEEAVVVSWQRTTPFLAAASSLEEAEQVIIGVPLDHTTSFRAGTREGPRRVREVSEGLESYSPIGKASLEERRIADVGDLVLPWGDVERSLAAIEAAVSGFVEQGKRPVIIGGEHLLTLGALRAVARRWPELYVVQLDAHLDLRDEYLGQTLSHATVMRRAAELLAGAHPRGSAAETSSADSVRRGGAYERLIQLGVRSGTREEWELWELTWRFEGGLVDAARRAARELRGRPFYLSIDIDVADPAFAPGTGTPEPGGPTSAEVIEAVAALAAAGPVAADVVEVCPPEDPSDVTAILAAKLLREVLVAGGGLAGQG